MKRIFWQAEHWRAREVRLGLALTTRVGRVGAHYYGLVLHRFPLIALFYNNSWDNPALSAGIAVGPLELSLSFSIRCFPGT
jgi:hypothetical protein